MADSYRFEIGEGGLERLVVSTRLAEAHIYKHGTHITHFQPHAPGGGGGGGPRGGERPVLWVSPRSLFQPGKAIRGGVPICFPWFGAKADDPNAPSHGLVRTREWTLVGVDELDNGSVRASFDTDAGPLMIAHTITVGRALVMRLDVYNRGREPASFEAALHSYLHVGDVRRVSITGLEGAVYIDKVEGGARKPQGDVPITLDSETDRVFQGTESSVEVGDPVLERTITVDKSGSRSTVLWNPWSIKAASMSDMDPAGWPHMLCVETANVGENAVRLSAGASHTMTATLSVSPLLP